MIARRSWRGSREVAGAVPVPMRYLIIQDYKENRRKCTVTPLEGRPDVTFLRLRHPSRSTETCRPGPGILLALDGSPLDASDARIVDPPGALMIIDSTWARVSRVRKRLSLPAGAVVRSLPREIRTAYPRTSKLYGDPSGGLASIEALFAATVILGDPRPDLLEGYRWAREFLELNGWECSTRTVRSAESSSLRPE